MARTFKFEYNNILYGRVLNNIDALEGRTSPIHPHRYTNEYYVVSRRASLYVIHSTQYIIVKYNIDLAVIFTRVVLLTTKVRIS